MLPTNIMTITYMVLMAIGYILCQGRILHHSIDRCYAFKSTISQTVVGSGIYKMASSLSNGFGIAIPPPFIPVS